jgi:hypothetical protein
MKVTLAICAAVILLPATTRAAETPPLRAGFAEADITPKIGMEAPGGYGKSYHQTVHDPCKVRVAVFDDGKKRIAVAAVDALALHGVMVQAVRKAVTAKCGIPAEAIMVCASHSHSSGPVFGFGTTPDEFKDASPLVRKLAYEQSTSVDPEYYTMVEKQIVAALCEADANRLPMRCGAGKGSESQAAFNRRFRMKSGLSFTHPGQGNPDIVEPAGPTDPEVGVVGAWDEKGELRGCLVNFACHATTSPGGISANYVFYLEQAIRGMFGPKVVVVFLAGTCGDVTQVDNRSPYVQPAGERWAKLVGGRVGAEAVKVLLTIEPGTLAPLDAATKVLEFKRRAPRPERLKAALEMVEKKPEEVGGHTPWIFAKEIVLLDASLAKAPVAEVEVQALQVGPVVLLGLPAEVFCQFGLDMKAKSGFPLTFPVTFANGCVGYIPTEEAFGPRGGGYETRLTSYTNLDITAGRRMVEAAVELSRQMKPGAIPTPPKAKPGTPWSYGNVPPEVD